MFIRDQFVIGEETRLEFGTMTNAFGKVRMRVERKVMSSTKGLSNKITIPPNRFCAVSCAASAKVKPPSPIPVMMVVTFVPVSLRIAIPETVKIRTLTIFFKKVIRVLFKLTSRCSSSLLLNWKKEPDAQSQSLSRIQVITIIKLMRYALRRN